MTDAPKRQIDWENLPVHPAAERFPMMSDEQIDDLAADIKANGLRVPIVVWQDNTGAPEAWGAGTYGTAYLLDGRNRMEALRRLGVTDPTTARKKFPNGIEWAVQYVQAERVFTDLTGKKVRRELGTDPDVLSIALNLKRRHLSREQYRDAIAAAIACSPGKSSRAIAKEIGVDKNTVTRVKNIVATENGVPLVNLTTGTASQRAAEVIESNPDASIREVAKQAGVGRGTAERAKTTGRKPAAPAEPKPEQPKADPSTHPFGEAVIATLQKLLAAEMDESVRRGYTDRIHLMLMEHAEKVTH